LKVEMNNCKYCKKPLSEKSLYFSDETAIENGYCSWFCMKVDLGFEQTIRIMKEACKIGLQGENKNKGMIKID